MRVSASRRQVLTALAALPLAMSVPFGSGSTQSGPAAPPAAPRRAYFGTAVRPDQIFGDPKLRDALIRDCTCLTPEVHLKWSAIEWDRGRPWFANVDAIIAFAREHRMEVRGHTLLWEQTTPGWAREAIETDQDWGVIDAHFANLLPRYRDSIGEWDVVNEPIDTEQGDDGLRRNVFQRAFGPNYIVRALESARALAPEARLMINDYSLEYDNPVDEARRAAMLGLVERLKRAGAPLDGVGLQAHLDLGKGRLPARRLEAFFGELAGMGVDIVITELDVREADRGLPLATRDARVAEAAREYLDLALAQPAVTGIVTWGLSDRYSWLQEQAPRTKAALAARPLDGAALNRGLPYCADFGPKPLHAAVMGAMAAAA